MSNRRAFLKNVLLATSISLLPKILRPQELVVETREPENLEGYYIASRTFENEVNLYEPSCYCIISEKMGRDCLLSFSSKDKTWYVNK